MYKLFSMFGTKYISICLLITFGLTKTMAQDAASGQSSYKEAADLAYGGEYDEARALLQQIMVKVPEHQDSKFLLGLVQAWDKQYAEARKIFTGLIEENYTSAEVFQALARLEIWDKKPVEAIKVCEQGLEKYPDDVTLRYLKAEALAALKSDEEAIALLEAILAEDPEHKEAQKLLKELLARRNKNAIAVDYSYSWFSNTFSPWHRTSLEYRRNLRVGPVIGRVNYAHMYDQSALQAEADAYPAINPLTYTYLNMGVSDGKIISQFQVWCRAIQAASCQL